ncbi:MAG: DUF4269 domain-containing protein [Alphaproteobacteria bacterium]
MTQNFLAPDYSRRGNSRQRAAYTTLMDLALFERLAAYGPVLAGTIPIAIDVADSDLDILCRVSDFMGFANDVEAKFAGRTRFRMSKVVVRQGAPSLKASFIHGGFEVEIFGQDRPVIEQWGYRPMVVEARLLDLGGAALRTAIMALRHQGLKTEPAFARLLGLAGDPYEAMVELETSSDDELRRLLDNLAKPHGG